MEIIVYGCNDVPSSLTGKQVSSGSRSSSRMKACLAWNKHRTAKTTGARLQRLSAPRASSNAAKAAVRHGMTWHFRKRQDTPRFRGIGVKIDKEVYQRDIFEAVVLLWTLQLFGRAELTSAYREKTTLERCNVHFLGFITTANWLPYPPDLT